MDAATPDSRPALALSWALILIMGAATGLALLSLGVSTSSSVIPGSFILLLAGLSYWHLRFRRIPRLLGCVGALLQFLLILPLGLLLSFAAASGDAPLSDALLLAADRSIGFDWVAYARWVDERPWLVIAYRWAYISFLLQPLVLIVALSLTADLRRLSLFSFAFSFTLMITCLIFVFVPAVSVYAHLQVPLTDFQHVQPISTFQHIPFIEGMRSGTIPSLDPFARVGLITFPSFHACGAVLLAWGFWGVPPLRLPALMLNLVMLGATPIDGAHYLVDVIAGMALAAFGIAVAKALEKSVGPSLVGALERAAAPLIGHPAFIRTAAPHAPLPELAPEPEPQRAAA